jgi:hypothetical protein
MRKLIFILILIIANINSFSQDVVGSRVIAKEAFFLRDRWIDSIRIDTVNIENDNRTLMTAGAIYKFVSNRMGGGGSNQRFGVSGEDDNATGDRNFHSNGYGFEYDSVGSMAWYGNHSYNYLSFDGTDGNRGLAIFFMNTANTLQASLDAYPGYVSWTAGGSDYFQMNGTTHNLQLHAGNTHFEIYSDSVLFQPHLGQINIDTIRNGSTYSVNKLIGWRDNNGVVGYVSIGSGLDLTSGELTATGGGVDQDYVDTTFIKVATYTADQKRGNVLGTIYEETGFSTLDTFVTSGTTTPTISNSMILLGGGATDGQVTLKRYTMLNRWALKSGFKVGAKNGSTLSFNMGVASVNTTYVQNIIGVFHHRSTPSQYDGFLTLQDGEFYANVLGTSATAVSFSAGDSIEVTLSRNVNIFTFTARNVTTDGDPVSVSYTYTGYTTAVNTGRPFLSATGSDSVYYFHFYSNESTGADLITIGDSKYTWYGISINEAIPSQFYALDGNVINHSGSGDKTLEVTLTTSEIIALTPRQALINIGSNDIRNGVAEATWQANIDTIYNRLTAGGITVYFALAYETAISQTDLVDYLVATYPTRYIANGYDTTFNCTSCLQSDDIHLTSYGDSIWVAGIEQSEMVDFGSSSSGYTELTQFVGQTAWRIYYTDGSGNYTALALGASGTVLQSNGASSAPSWETAGGTTWNAITDPTGDQALSFAAGESTTWTDANTTEDFLTINNATQTTSSMFSLNRTSTALTTNNNMMELISSGANSVGTTTATGLSISVTNTGTGATNVGLNVTASGAATGNYAALFTGRVGISQTAPQAALHVGAGGTATAFGSVAQITVSNSGSSAYINIKGPNAEMFMGAESGFGIVGTIDNYPFAFRSNNTLRAQLTTAGTLLMSYGVVEKQGADVASVAGAITLGVDGNAFEITGTNAITLIANTNFQNGHVVTLLFTSTATLTDGTANSGSNIGMELAGNTNFVASAGATVTLRLMELGGTQRWYEVARSVQ